MAAADYIQVAQQLYVAYFGRPADYYGLADMTNALNAAGAPTTIAGFAEAYTKNATVKAVMDNFGTSTESKALYGDDTASNARFINAVYSQVLGRPADLDGLNFWVQALKDGAMTRASAAVQILAAAVKDGGDATDAATANNKVAVATNFTNAINDASEVIGYSGDAAAAAARALLADVTSTTVPSAYQATVDAALEAIAHPIVPGATFNLTTGIDTGSAFVGGTGADTFVATITDTAAGTDVIKLGAGDSLKGGAGIDTLQITDDSTAGAATSVTGVYTDSIEKILIQNAGTNTFALDAANMAGVTTVTVNDAQDTVTVTNLAAIVATEVNRTSQNVTVNYAAAAVSGSNDSATVTLNGFASTAGAVFTSNGIETLNVATATAASGVDSSDFVTLDGSSLKKVVITGSQDLVARVDFANAIDGSTAAKAATIDASAFTGSLVVDLTSNGGALSANGYVSVAGGTGDDTITVGTLTSNSTLVGGAGTDTLVVAALAGGTGTTSDFKNVSGFEALQFSGALGASLDLSANNISSVEFNDIAGNTITGVSSGVTAGFLASNTSGGGALSLTNAASSTTDVVNLNLGNASTAAQVVAGTISVSNVETINLASNSGTNVTDHTITLSDAALTTLNISGKEGVVVSSTDTTALTTVTVTNTNTTSGVDLSGLTVSASGATIKGNTGADKLTGGVGNDNISGGAGNDIIVGAGGKDTLDGGDGNDSITGGSGVDSIIGGAGDDTVIGAAGNDNISLGDGNDTIKIDDADLTSADVISGGAGNDSLIVTSHTTSFVDADFTGVSGIETLTADTNVGIFSDATGFGSKFAAAGVTTITGNGTGADAIVFGSGFTGAITINTATGDDKFDGSASAATFTVKATDSSITAADTIKGGSGAADVLILTASGGAAVLGANSGGFETITINASATPTQGTSLTLDDANSADTATVTINASALTNDQAVFTLAAGNEVGAKLVVTGGNADDVLTTGGGADTVNGGAGNDTLSTGAGNDSITGGSGNDTITAGDGNDTATGDAGNDSIDGGNGNDNLSGGAGNDYLVGGAGNDTLDGGEGADVIQGGAGNDSIVGGVGNDTITGGAGADYLNAGEGNDTVVYTAASESLATDAATFAGDTIDGFDFATDSLQVASAVSGSVTNVTIATADLASLATTLAANTGLNTALAQASNDAALVTISAGTAAGTYLIIQQGSNTSFNASNDLVIKLVNATNTTQFGAANFTVPTTNYLAAATSNFAGSAADDILSVSTASTITPLVATGTLNGGAGSNTLKLQDGSSIAAATVSNFTNLTFDATGATGATDVTMTLAQHNAFTGTVTAAGTESVSVTTAGALTGFAGVESYTLAAGTNTFTLGAGAQNVTGGSGNDTINVGAGTIASGTINLAGGTNHVVLGAGATLSSTVTTTGSVDITMSGATASITAAAHGTNDIVATGSGAGAEALSITTVATGLTLDADVETYVLGNFANTVTLGTTAGSLAQNVTGGSSTDVLTLGAGTYTGTWTSISGLSAVAGTTNIAGVNTGSAFDAGTTLAIANTGTVEMTSAQYNSFASITGTGTNAIILSTAGTVTANASVESYTLNATGSDTITFTLGSTATQSVDLLASGGSDSVVLNNSALDVDGIDSFVTISHFQGTTLGQRDVIQLQSAGTAAVGDYQTLANAGGDLAVTGKFVELNGVAADLTDVEAVKGKLTADVGTIADGTYYIVLEGTASSVAGLGLYQAVFANAGAAGATADNEWTIELVGFVSGGTAVAFGGQNIG